ncbi:hypothetical protein, partial [uncultured Parabacteroides sp.]|uniref:hypothetical protein n=1 Tax=uncultured Parabacteroides sp. TaxID=512312 RepID=UPI00272A6E98
SKPNKKYKCSCEDIQCKILVKYLIDFYLKNQISSTILIPFYYSTAAIGKCRRYPSHTHTEEAQKKLFQGLP